MTSNIMLQCSVLSSVARKGYHISNIRMLSISLTSVKLHSTDQHVHQQKYRNKSSTVSETTPRPYSDIPKTKTVLGFNTDMITKPSQFGHYLEKSFHEFGSIFKLILTPGLSEMVCIVDPKDVETVYRMGDTAHPERMDLPDIKRVFKELNQPLGLFFQEGEEWYKHRMPISKFIMMPRKMAEYHEPFNHVAMDYINLVKKQRFADNVLLDVTSSLNKWSLESITFFLLGKRLGCLGDEMPPDCRKFVDDLRSFSTDVEKILFGIPFHRIWRNKKWRNLVRSVGGFLSYASDQVNQKVREIEQQTEELSSGVREAEPELGMDFLTYMIHCGKMTVPEIAAHTMDLLIAGVDSTSFTMAGCAYSLANNPEVQEKLREEVLRVVGKEELITPSHIQDMHYLRDTIKETTRLLPVAPNTTRVLNEDVVLSGYKVPAGVNIAMPLLAPGRLPELFPEPDKFKPERWSREGNVELPNSFSSLPFGFGRRSCVGRRVAELEMHILLSQLMKNFRIECRDEKPMEFENKLLYGPGRQMDLAFIDN